VSRPSTTEGRRVPAAALTALLLVIGFSVWQATLGADAFWVVALGRHILDSASVPRGIPFASAPTTDWHNVPVVAEVIFAVATIPGDRALVALQGVLSAATLVTLTVTALRRGARDVTVAVVVCLVAAMSVQALVIVRLQMLSLLPFALLMVLLTAEARRPTRRIWLVPALVAVWANLHGAVLVGGAVLGCYLLLSRVRTRAREAVAVGAASLLAVFITPAGPGTIHYYLGVFSNEAAKRGSDLWAAPDPRRPFDALMVAAALLLGFAFLRRRRAAWEYLAATVLVVATLVAARNGVWLALGLFLLATGAPGRGEVPPADNVRPTGHRAWLVSWFVWGVLTSVVYASLLVSKDEVAGYVPQAVVGAVRGLAGPHGVVLATEPGVEQLAADGLTVWVSDPIDAFAPGDQSTYLDFLAGDPSGLRALDEADVVAVETGRPALRLVEGSSGWVRASVRGSWHLFVRETPR
jgi:hypothetical protein